MLGQKLVAAGGAPAVPSRAGEHPDGKQRRAQQLGGVLRRDHFGVGHRAGGGVVRGGELAQKPLGQPEPVVLAQVHQGGEGRFRGPRGLETDPLHLVAGGIEGNAFGQARQQACHRQLQQPVAVDVLGGVNGRGRPGKRVLIALGVHPGGVVFQQAVLQGEHLGGHAAVGLGAVHHYPVKIPAQFAELDGNIAGDRVVGAGGVDFPEGVLLPGVHVGRSGKVPGALLFGGNVHIHGKCFVNAVFIKVCEGQLAVSAQGVFGDVPLLVEVGGNRGRAACGAGGASPADDHVICAVAVQVPKAHQVHLGGSVPKGGGCPPAVLALFQKADFHAPVQGHKAHRVLHAVPRPVVHEDGRAVVPPFGVHQRQLLLVPLEELVNALLVQAGPGRGHQVWGVQPGEGAPCLGQAQRRAQGQGGQALDGPDLHGRLLSRRAAAQPMVPKRGKKSIPHHYSTVPRKNHHPIWPSAEPTAGASRGKLRGGR